MGLIVLHAVMVCILIKHVAMYDDGFWSSWHSWHWTGRMGEGVDVWECLSVHFVQDVQVCHVIACNCMTAILTWYPATAKEKCGPSHCCNAHPLIHPDYNFQILVLSLNSSEMERYFSAVHVSYPCSPSAITRGLKLRHYNLHAYRYFFFLDSSIVFKERASGCHLQLDAWTSVIQMSKMQVVPVMKNMSMYALLQDSSLRWSFHSWAEMATEVVPVETVIS